MKKIALSIFCFVVIQDCWKPAWSPNFSWVRGHTVINSGSTNGRQDIIHLEFENGEVLSIKGDSLLVTKSKNRDEAYKK
jgi:hypothetical protein